MNPAHKLLYLHEAIAVVLLGCENKTSTTIHLANEINRRGLYIRKDKKALPAYQVMQRTKLSNGRYHHLFLFISPNIVSLK